MKRSVAILLLATAFAAALAARVFTQTRSPELPFHGTDAASLNAWQDFGGLWNVQDGVIFNRSDELGAKLVAGSPSWSNYRFTADMRMLGHSGEVGVIVRVNDMGVGINAYRGYYAGYRTMDNSLILGFSDRDWIETRPVPFANHLLLKDWLHVNVAVVGCDIAAELTVIRTGETIRSMLHQDSCVPRGRVGLRSLSSGAAWKNITALPAGEQDIAAMRRFVPVPGRAVYPTREDDLVRMLMQEPSTPDRFFSDFVRDKDDSSDLSAMAAARPIASLDTSLQGPITATLQGVVTHVDPIYIQDNSGGIAVHAGVSAALNLGDEVEVVGQAVHTGAAVYFNAASVRVLWDDAPTRPVAINSAQAASGLFEGSLVELSGKLLARDITPDGKIRLRMSSGTEVFSVVVQQSLSRHSLHDWEVGSTLRVRGVCSSGQAGSQPSDLFQILPRSVADIQVVYGPSWTSGIRLVFLISLALLLLCAVAFAYVRAERWKMRTIYEERERLAADMHDTLAQGFAGVSYQLQSLRRGLRENATVPSPLMRRLDTACDLATETHREASTRITALHFSAGEEYDLIDVLNRAITFMIGSDSTLEVSTERTGSPRFLSLAIRDALFRIGHEAIANVLRHSRATRLILRLEFRDESVVLEIKDNGTGLANPEKHGFGIESMRARASECEGHLNIVTAVGAGTTISVSLPYQSHGRLWRKLRDILIRAARQPESKSDRQPI